MYLAGRVLGRSGKEKEKVTILKEYQKRVGKNLGSYSKHKTRETADQVLRSFIDQKIIELVDLVRQMQAEFISAQLITLWGEIDAIANAYREVALTIKQTDYGVSTFFTNKKLVEFDEEQLVSLDLALLGAMDKLEEVIESFREASETGIYSEASESSQTLQGIVGIVREFWERRTNLISEYRRAY